MPLFSKHRSLLYTPAGDELSPNDYAVGDQVEGLSNKVGKPNRKPLTFEVTQGPDGIKRFTLQGIF